MDIHYSIVTAPTGAFPPLSCVGIIRRRPTTTSFFAKMGYGIDGKVTLAYAIVSRARPSLPHQKEDWPVQREYIGDRLWKSRWSKKD